MTPRTQDDNFAFLWEGFIYIPTTTTYNFRTNSDDGSKVYLGALNGTGSPYSYAGTAIVNNDGAHSAQDITSATVTLTTGVYPIAITYFEQAGGETMSLVWRTGSGTTYAAIPNNYFTDGAAVNGQAPAVPTTLVATAASFKRANLTWKDNSTNETGFEIWRSTNASTGFAIVTTTGPNAIAYPDSSLNAATTYYYKLKAIGQYGESAFTANANCYYIRCSGCACYSNKFGSIRYFYI
ncbi:MAG: PA14 domain-containing protein [Chitinophagaceae bacterium]